MTDTYDLAGPLGRDVVTASNTLGGLCGSITFDHHGRILTVCLGVTDPTLYLLDATTLGVIASYVLPPRLPSEAGENPLQD